MKRVTGIGGIFFKAKDPKALGAWYKEHLGIDVQAWGGAVIEHEAGSMAWSVFPSDAKKFAPGSAAFMVNYRVADLDALLDALKAEGVRIEGKPEDSEYGKFGWIVDPEGNKIELWQPPAGQ